MRKLFSLSVLLILLILTGCAKDEVNPFGSIYGVVVDSSNSSPLQGARITLTPTGKSTVTGNDGSYEFVDIEPGNYKVTVQADGFNPTMKNVTVVAGEKAIGDVSISPIGQNSKIGVDKAVVNFTKDLKINTINISNLGNAGDINWEITNIPSWLDVNPAKGSTGVGKQSAVTLKLNGSHTGETSGSITINADGESISVLISVEKESEGDGGNTGDGEDTGDNNDYSSAKITSCDPDIEVGIVSCKRSGSNVTFKYYVINNKPEDIREFRIKCNFGGTAESQLADDTGKVYTSGELNIKFANQSPSVGTINIQLLKGLKTEGEIVIKGVSEKAKKLSVVKLSTYSYNQYDFLNETIDFRDVPIY